MRFFRWCGVGFACGVLMVHGVSVGQVVISEIMYNPDSNEGWPADPNVPGDQGKPNAVEWVEVYNAGDSAVDISGWALADEDGQTGLIRDGAILKPGEAAVIVPHHTSAAAFHAAWGGSFAVYPVTGWGDDGIYNLSNGPSADNEILRLIDADGVTVDEVNFDDEVNWPSDQPDGPSIYLPFEHLGPKANDLGQNWKLSEPGVDRAKKNHKKGDFNGEDIGSPGVVPRKQ
ncbi:MAG: hypothetical protein Kow00105_02060 [Phycisphaeraceae bacterium]